MCVTVFGEHFPQCPSQIDLAHYTAAPKPGPCKTVSPQGYFNNCQKIDSLINQANTGNWNIKVTISTHMNTTLQNFIIGYLDLNVWDHLSKYIIFLKFVFDFTTIFSLTTVWVKSCTWISAFLSIRFVPFCLNYSMYSS